MADIESIIKSIQENLSEDLLKKKYRREVYPHVTTGHCYLATEALYHLIGKELGYKPMCCSLGEGRTHWYLQHPDGSIADPTAEQYLAVGEEPPYHLGKGKGFCTLYPSKRAVTLMERIKNG